MTNNSAFEVHMLKSLLKRNLTNPNNYMNSDGLSNLCTFHWNKLDVFNILPSLPNSVHWSLSDLHHHSLNLRAICIYNT